MLWNSFFDTVANTNKNQNLSSLNTNFKMKHNKLSVCRNNPPLTSTIKQKNLKSKWKLNQLKSTRFLLSIKNVHSTFLKVEKHAK